MVRDLQVSCSASCQAQAQLEEGWLGPCPHELWPSTRMVILWLLWCVMAILFVNTSNIKVTHVLPFLTCTCYSFHCTPPGGAWLCPCEPRSLKPGSCRQRRGPWHGVSKAVCSSRNLYMLGSSLDHLGCRYWAWPWSVSVCAVPGSPKLDPVPVVVSQSTRQGKGSLPGPVGCMADAAHDALGLFSCKDMLFTSVNLLSTCT